MKGPLISIALCTYNGERYLAEQLDSIINQTFKNLEVIVVDDCSTDNTLQILANYAEMDVRIKYYQNSQNLGYNKNFEKALKLTTGNFIAISDQDDNWKPNKIQVLMDNIEDNWLVFSNSEYINADGTLAEGKLLNGFSLAGKNYKALLLNNHITGHTTLFSREFLKYILPFPETGFYDWWMGFIAFYHHKLLFVDEVLTRYRQHDNAVTSSSMLNKQQLGYSYVNRIHEQLNVFAKYKGAKPADEDYINKLNNAFNLKFTNKRSMALFKIVLKDYHELFPTFKVRKKFSKAAFALRFSKRISNIN